jgi:RNA polymerase sigma-70 factor (ECF subfamily)
MQQTLLACLEARARFRQESSFRTFMFQIARFQLYAYYRARHRDRIFDFAHVSAVDVGDSPSRAMARRQDAQHLLHALRCIPLDAQIVLELRFWEELTGPEIAEVLEVPEATVRSRLRRALDHLRTQLSALDAGAVPLRETNDDLDRWAARLHEELDADGRLPPDPPLGDGEGND